MKVFSHSNYFRLILGILSLHFLESAGLICEYYNVNKCGRNGSNSGQSGWNSSDFGDSGGDCGYEAISCGEETSYRSFTCFAVWKKREIDNETAEVLQFKGCFLNDKHCPGRENCVARDYGKASEGDPGSLTFFCCCSTDFCNGNYRWSPDPTSTTVKPKILLLGSTSVPSKSRPFLALILILISVVCLGFAIMGGYFFRKHILAKRLRNNSESRFELESLSRSRMTNEEKIIEGSRWSESSLDQSLERDASIKLIEEIACGRFGKVWKGSMRSTMKSKSAVDADCRSRIVAVKILPAREMTSWRLEKDICTLPLVAQSDLILKFICAKQQVEGKKLRELWLVSEYLDCGSLYDFLKVKTLKWNELLRIASTMCEGLSFLHEEIDGGPTKGYKPAVVHRDFKSKNVLLRSDLTACLADFGLAYIFDRTKPMGNCLGQVGTRLYMAPEVLEGAVSFTRDHFQRIDMYACGLVLWELASRYSVSSKGQLGDYKLPYEEHIGPKPTLEEMIKCVVIERKRPTFQNFVNDWKNEPGMILLTEAMKDSWDPDAEARISASCVVERLKTMTL